MPAHSIQVDDSERTGTHILGALHDQRAQLEDAREQNENVDASLQRSNRMIRRMFYRAFTIKVGLSCFALLLVVAIAVIVYLKWIAKLINHNSPQPPSPPSPAASRRLSEERDAALGDGLIALVAIGAVFLFACCFARASRPALKCGVFCSLFCVYLVIVLFLVLLPKKDYSQARASHPRRPAAPSAPRPARPTAAAPHRRTPSRRPPPRTTLAHLTARRACTTFNVSAWRTQDDSELEKLSDVAGLLRIFLGILLGLCAIIGPILVLVTHVLPFQKAPVLPDDCEELSPAVA